jgi:hypothetical protein
VTDWILHVRESQPVALEGYVQALSAFVDGPVETEREELSGNPRDGYYRGVTLRAQRPGDDVRIEMWLIQATSGLDESDVTTRPSGCSLHVPIATRQATWTALRDALARIGCTLDP